MPFEVEETFISFFVIFTDDVIVVNVLKSSIMRVSLFLFDSLRK